MLSPARSLIRPPPQQVNLNGQVMQVTCPPTASAGMPIMINVPGMAGGMNMQQQQAMAGRQMYQGAMMQPGYQQPMMMHQPGVVMAPQPMMVGGGMGYGYGGKKARPVEKFCGTPSLLIDKTLLLLASAWILIFTQ